MTRYAEADRAAAELKERVARCEMCGCANMNDLETHEILRGIGLRRLSRGVPCCSLILCNHRANNCHAMMDGKPWEWQLAILWRSRPEEFDLFEFWKIAGRRKPLVEELLTELCPPRKAWDQQ